MVTIGSLWIPILVSAIIVWFASFIVWVVLPHHKSEYKGLPDEDATFKSLGDIPPGLYNLPHLTSMEEVKSRKSSRGSKKGQPAFSPSYPEGSPSVS